MSKITLNNVGSLIDATTAVNTINANTAAIVTAFDNTLSRDGTSPNTMGANFDMNSHSILNLPAPTDLSQPVRLQDLNNAALGTVNITYDMLPTEADSTLLGNISGATHAPAANTIASILDKQLGTTRGSVAFRGASNWTSLSPGTSGQLLQTQGAGVDPLWAGSIAGTGTVTSIGSGNGLTTTLTLSPPGSSITNTGVLSTTEVVNSQVGVTYTVVDGDRAKLITFSNASSIAVTLPQAGAASAFQSGWYADFSNKGVGAVTITPTTSTINGNATLILRSNQGIRIVSDGTNYQINYGNTVTVTKQIFTSNGTYTSRPGLLYAIVECQGAGGGSAGATGGVGFLVGGGGGGGGGYSKVFLTSGQIGASQTVSVGAGGAAGTSASNGGVGGTTSFGALCISTGGNGGIIGTTGSIGSGGTGGAGSTGDILIQGENGEQCFYAAISSVLFAAGKGGNSHLGIGGRTLSPSAAGNNGTPGLNYGGGGSGAAIHNVVGTSTGAAGAIGICVVTEFSLQ